MTLAEIESLFEVDEQGCFTKLVLPKDSTGEEISLIGKKRTELSLDLIIRVKKYAGKLYQEALEASR